MINKIWKIVICCLLLAFSDAASAETKWGVGAVSIGQSSNYIGKGDSIKLFPNVSYQNDYYSIGGRDWLSFPLIKTYEDNGAFAQFSLQFSPRMAPDFGDDPYFNGMSRDYSIDAGIKGQVGWAFLTLDFDAKHDLLGVYDGYEMSLSPGLRTRIGKAGLGISAGLRFRDAHLNQYLYGVYEDEATSSRMEFAPSESITAIASASAFVPMNDHVSFIGVLSYEDLSPLKPNPLLESYDSMSLLIGVNYSF